MSLQVQLNTGQLQYIRLAQPVSGTQVVQGQIQTLATNTQQVKHLCVKKWELFIGACFYSTVSILFLQLTGILSFIRCDLYLA